jgi:hypothetical protein
VRTDMLYVFRFLTNISRSMVCSPSAVPVDEGWSDAGEARCWLRVGSPAAIAVQTGTVTETFLDTLLSALAC